MAILRTIKFILILFVVVAFFACVSANPPIIHYSHNMRVLKIPSNTEPGSIIYRIKATDSDNDDIIFDVLEDYGKILLQFRKINHNEANVILSSVLEENDEHNLTIYATDTKETTYIESRLIATPAPETATTDLNPIILEYNPVYVYENETINKSVTVIRAHDRQDSKLPVTFEMDDNEIFDFRYIFGPHGMSTAEIILVNELNYEQTNLYILNVLAINAKTNEEFDTRNVHSVQLTIVVKDVQDTPPVLFNLPQFVSISNLYKMNEMIYQVRAEDGDTTNKRNITFLIESPENQYFHIKLDGSVHPTLNYSDLSEIYDTNLPIRLKIRASEIVIDDLNYNSSATSISELIILFTIVNRAPQFINKRALLGTIDEHSSHLTAVTWQPDSTTAQVIDLEFGLNGTFELDVIDPTYTFTVKPTLAYQRAFFSLVINDSTSLDFENRTNLTVVITATDKSKELPLRENVTCTILINDINDNYPQFSQNLYQSRLYENAEEGTVVAVVSATDKDSMDFGQVRYTAIKGIFSDNLKLDFNNGTVSLANNHSLDRETIDEYIVTIEARDNLGYGNANSTQLYIKILDINDNRPIFLQPNYLAVVNTDFIHPLQITAIDIDEVNTVNSLVNYEILFGNQHDLFEIDTNTGNVTISKEISQIKVKQNPIVLTVRAYDLGIPQMSSTTKIFIYFTNLPNIIRTLFITNKTLNLQHANKFFENHLSNITGANVTINEFKHHESKQKPIAIVATVEYNKNETIVDLDQIVPIYNELIVQHEKTIGPIEEIEDDFVSHNSSSRYVTNESKNINTVSQQHDLVTTRSIHTAGVNQLNILMLIMALLILLLLLFLLYLICLLCKNRRNSKDEIETITKQTVIRPKRRKQRAAKRNRTNKIALSSHNPVFSNGRAVADNKESSEIKQNSNDADYEVEEGKQYSTTPSLVTYCEFKRLRYPKTNDSNDSNVFQNIKSNLDYNAGSDAISQIENRIHNLTTHAKVKIKSHISNANREEELMDSRNRANEISAKNQHTDQFNGSLINDYRSRQTDPKQLSNNNQALIGSVDWDNDTALNRGNELNQHNQIQYHHNHHLLNKTTNSSKPNNPNAQRRSIFTIAYDKISNRENISSGSDKIC